jgi:5-formyltetrahydrofolate cyclo-ligase
VCALAPVERWRPLGVVAGYGALEDEIDPAPLLARLQALGARIVMPVVAARGAALIFREAGKVADWTPDAAGISAPPPGAFEAVPDLLLVPLLAFDRAGGRLGQGGGYYDRTLAVLRARGPVRAIGLAFAGQEVGQAPMGPRDQRLDAVLTERAYIEI